jgi:hypothetical protein
MTARDVLGRWLKSRAGALAALLLALALAAPAGAAANTAPADLAQGEAWYIAPTLKRFFRSHTSYEFGDPDDRRLSPLSRLEYPLNSWWGGLRLGAQGPKLSLELELLTGLPGQDDLGALRDSDWTDPDRPKVKTVYSETTLRLKDSLSLDAKAAVSLREHLPLPAWLDLRPLIGVRWQRFTFVAGDGVQQELLPDPAAPGGYTWIYEPLDGDVFWFRQDYIHAYAGLMVSADLARLGLGQPGQGWRVSLQGDLAQVWGQNRDWHLLRGDRVTQERTQGHAWHTAMSLRAPLWSWGSLTLTGDYMFISTTGDHTWDDPPYPVETSDYGVRVWSQQMSLSLALEIPF